MQGVRSPPGGIGRLSDAIASKGKRSKRIDGPDNRRHPVQVRAVRIDVQPGVTRSRKRTRASVVPGASSRRWVAPIGIAGSTSLNDTNGQG